MPAIFGIVGEHSESQLQLMGERLSHKGQSIDIWSPARNVGFGEVRHWPRQASEDPGTAACVQFDVDWTAVDRNHAIGLQDRDQYRRGVLRRQLADDPAGTAARLGGIFSYAHWMADSKRLILAVDRFSFETLYYVRIDRALAFASDYKALLALPEVRIRPNVDAIQYAISVSSIDLRTTLADGIMRVPRHHQLVVDGDTESLTPLWRPRVEPQRINRKKAAANLRNVLIEQVRSAVDPFDRISLTLSGGLDSSGLLALVRHVKPGAHITTYTIGHSEEDPEIIGARASADHFGTDHHELIFEPDSILTDLPRLVWLAEELAGREEMILQYQVEQSLADKEDVLITGSGADMVFAGMPRHRLVCLAQSVPFAKRPLTELFQQTQSGKVPETLRGRVASQLLYRGKNIVPPRLRNSAGPTTVFEPDSLDSFIEHTIVEMDSLHYHSATKAAAMTETLMPFLSNAVLDHSLTIPGHYKASPFGQKMVLREALAPLLPDAIRNRGKAIQRVKNDAALTSVLDRMADEYLGASSLSHRGLINDNYVSGLRRRGKSGVYSSQQLARLWMLLISEIWCRTFVDNRGRAL